jgi:hypothetical protein
MMNWIAGSSARSNRIGGSRASWNAWRPGARRSYGRYGTKLAQNLRRARDLYTSGSTLTPAQLDAELESLRAGVNSARAHTEQMERRWNRVYASQTATARRAVQVGARPRERRSVRRPNATRGSPDDPSEPEPPPRGRLADELTTRGAPPWRAAPILCTFGALPIPAHWRAVVFLHMPEHLQARAYRQLARWSR